MNGRGQRSPAGGEPARTRQRDRRQAAGAIATASALAAIALFLMPGRPLTQVGVLVAAAGMAGGGIAMLARSGRLLPRPLIAMMWLIVGGGGALALLGAMLNT